MGFLRRYMGMALPISLQFLMWSLVPACDALMLGRIGQDEMASVSLAMQVPFLMYMLLTAFAVGMSVLGAQYHGKGDGAAVGDVFLLGLKFLIGLSWLFAALAIFSPGLLMSAFTADPTLIALGCEYLRIAGVSYLFGGVSLSLHTILKAVDHFRFSVGVSVGIALLNVVLNYMLIFGVGPIPPLGVRGVAFATVVSIVVEALTLVSVSWRAGYFRPQWNRLFVWRRALVGDYLRCALPILGAYATWSAGLASYSSVLGHLGADAAAANAVVMVVRDLLCCLCEGGATAAAILVGQELGRGNLVRGRVMGARIVRLSIVLGLVCAAFALVSLPIVLKCVILSDAARSHVIGMMFVLAFYLFGRYVNTIVIAGVFSAGGDTMFDFYSLVSTMWGVAVPVAFAGAFVFHWPVALVFACTCIDEVGKLPWTWAHYKRYLWVRDLTSSRGEDADTVKVKI